MAGLFVQSHTLSKCGTDGQDWLRVAMDDKLSSPERGVSILKCERVRR